MRKRNRERWDDVDETEYLSFQRLRSRSRSSSTTYRLIIPNAHRVVADLPESFDSATPLEIYRSDSQSATRSLFEQLLASLVPTLQAIAEGEARNRVDTTGLLPTQPRLEREQIDLFLGVFAAAAEDGAASPPVAVVSETVQPSPSVWRDNDVVIDEMFTGPTTPEADPSAPSEAAPAPDESEGETDHSDSSRRSRSFEAELARLASGPLPPLGSNEEMIARLLRQYDKTLKSLLTLTRSKKVALTQRNVPRILRRTARLKKLEWRLRKEFFIHNTIVQRMKSRREYPSELSAYRRIRIRQQTFDIKRAEADELQREALFRSILRAAVEQYNRLQEARRRRSEEIRRRQISGEPLNEDDEQEWQTRLLTQQQIRQQRRVSEQDLITRDVELRIAKCTQRELEKLDRDMNEVLEMVGDLSYLAREQDPLIEALEGQIGRAERNVKEGRREVRAADGFRNARSSVGVNAAKAVGTAAVTAVKCSVM